MEFLKKYWFVLLVIVLAVALYVSFRKGILNLFDFRSEDEKKAEEEIDKLEYDSRNLTITVSDAILISQQLLAAMDKYGTDEKTIITLLSQLNRDDLLYVMKIFGVHQYNGAGSSVGLDRWIYSQNLNLIGWLKSELSGKDLATVAGIFQSYNIPF
jgi:hypothetical protein